MTYNMTVVLARGTTITVTVEAGTVEQAVLNAMQAARDQGYIDPVHAFKAINTSGGEQS